MILLASKIPDVPGQYGTHLVFCEGCGGVSSLSNWKCKIKPARKCASCAAKNRWARERNRS